MIAYIFIGIASVLALVGVWASHDARIDQLDRKTSYLTGSISRNNEQLRITNSMVNHINAASTSDPDKLEITVSSLINEIVGEILDNNFKIDDVEWRVIKVSKVLEPASHMGMSYSVERYVLECERVKKEAR